MQIVVVIQLFCAFIPFQMTSLQEKLHSTSLVCQRSSEHNMQLQLSLQQQQTMLTESTARISELEENQSQLQKQVGRNCQKAFKY